MRVLIYGGTQYAERRRIGDWSDSISGQILQSTEGLSERRPVYGVGLDNDRPFLIFRLMVTHGRSYPLTILLDPGPMWPDFGWNGPLILSLLFDHFSDVGSVFFQEPENLNSVTDIEERLIEVKEAGKKLIQESVKLLEGVEENLVYLLTAGATLNYPRMIGTSPGLGFTVCPTYVDMTRVMRAVPLPLRSAVGWVMGGTHSYSSTFNTSLIFDENQVGDADSETANLHLLTQGREWYIAWKNVEAKVSTVGDPVLTNLMTAPLAEWESANARPYPDYTRIDLFNDMCCIGGLLESATDFFEKSSAEVAQRYEAFLRGVTDGPLHLAIEDLFDKREKDSTRLLNPAETVYVLRKIYEHPDDAYKLSNYESRLEPLATIDYLAQRRIYPSQQLVPQGSELGLLERLFSSESVRDLPLKVVEEIGYLAKLRSLTAAQQERLVRAAVNRTAAEPRGLTVWTRYLRDSEYGEAIQMATEEAALAALDSQAEAWQESFFLFVAEQKAIHFPNENPKVITDLMQYALQQQTLRSMSDEVAELRARARAWLADVGGADIREDLDLTEKIRVAKADIENWEGLRGLDTAFNYATGEAGTRKPLRTVFKEQRFLISELKQFVASADVGAHPPNLQLVYDQFAFAGAGEELTDFFRALEPLLEEQPDLNSDYATGWVDGWHSIAKLAQRFAQNKFVEKFHAEAVRYLLESSDERARKWPFQLNDLADKDATGDHLRELFVNLLFQGDHSKDAAYARRLLDFSTEIKKKLLPVLQETIVHEIEDNQLCRTFFRRFGDQRKCLELLKSALNEEQTIRLDERRSELRDQLTAEHQNAITKLFSGTTEDRDYAEQFIRRLQESLRDGSVGQSAFRHALDESFQNLSSDERKVFMFRFGGHEKALNEIKERLAPQLVPDLDESISDYETNELSKRIEALLSRDSSEAKLVLADFLKKEQRNPKLTDAVSSAVIRCLDTELCRDTFYIHFMLTADRLRIKRKDWVPHLNLLFANLKPPVQEQLLEFVFRKGPEAFHRMVSRGFQEYKNDLSKMRDLANLRSVDERYRQAVFAFLWTRSGEAALKQLLRGTADDADLVLAVLKDYKDLAFKMDPEGQSNDTNTQPSKEMKLGFFGRLIH